MALYLFFPSRLASSSWTLRRIFWISRNSSDSSLVYILCQQLASPEMEPKVTLIICLFLNIYRGISQHTGTTVTVQKKSYRAQPCFKHKSFLFHDYLFFPVVYSVRIYPHNIYCLFRSYKLFIERFTGSLRLRNSWSFYLTNKKFPFNFW